MAQGPWPPSLWALGTWAGSCRRVCCFPWGWCPCRGVVGPAPGGQAGRGSGCEPRPSVRRRFLSGYRCAASPASRTAAAETQHSRLREQPCKGPGQGRARRSSRERKRMFPVSDSESGDTWGDGRGKGVERTQCVSHPGPQGGTLCRSRGPAAAAPSPCSQGCHTCDRILLPRPMRSGKASLPRPPSEFPNPRPPSHAHSPRAGDRVWPGPGFPNVSRDGWLRDRESSLTRNVPFLQIAAPPCPRGHRPRAREAGRST